MLSKITTHDKGITILNYFNKRWENIKQFYLGVIVAFPEDPGTAEEQMCIEQEEIFGRVTKDWDAALSEMTRKIAALKEQAEAPPTGPEQAVTLKARREKMRKDLRKRLA